MKCSGNSVIMAKINNSKLQHKRLLKTFNILKECGTLKWLQETEDTEFNIEVDFINDPVLMILQKIEPDKICSLAGELEVLLNAECNINVNIYDKTLSYNFYSDYILLLSIKLTAPICKFVIDKEEITYYKSTDVSSNLKTGRMVCE